MKHSAYLKIAAALVLMLMGRAGAAEAPEGDGPLWNTPFVTIDAQTQNATMGPGINLVNEPGAVHAKYMKTIKDAGFRTVRLAVSNITTSDAEGRPNDRWFRELDIMLNAALREGLTVIIDENVSEECQSDAQACTRRLVGTWEAVASRYRNAPNSVLFELLNEPYSGFTPAVWNDSLRKILKIVRATNPTRNVIIGPASWNMPGALRKLDLPEDDRHIIVTFHYYLPVEFTGQAAPWNQDTRALRDVAWGSRADREFLRRQFDAVASWSREHRRPVFLGEFGVYKTAPDTDRLSWIAVVARSAEARGISWAFWYFGPSFCGFDFDKNRWVNSTLNILITKDKR